MKTNYQVDMVQPVYYIVKLAYMHLLENILDSYSYI
jgi:hypothetical protein